MTQEVRTGLLVIGILGWSILATGQTLPHRSVYLEEGFNGTGIPVGWNVHQIVGQLATWSVVGTGTNPPVPPYSGSGQAKFNSYDAGAGEKARLTTPAINLTSANDPFIDFFMYHDDEFLSSHDSVYLEVTTADSITGPWQTLGGFQRPRTTNGWTKEAISLLPFAGSGRVFMSLRGVSQYGNNLYIDEFRVADSSFHDIGIVALAMQGSLAPSSAPTASDSPRRLKTATGTKNVSRFAENPEVKPVNHMVGFEVVVRNLGTFAEPVFEVQWEVDFQSQPPAGNSTPLQRNDLDTILLTWQGPTPGIHVLTAWTSLATDSNHTNDTARLVFEVLDSSVVFYEPFNESTLPPTGWTTINRDGGTLAPWFLGTSTSVFPPFEGSGFAADNFQRANGTYLDDYLITPSVPGFGQPGMVDSLVFWARSVFYPPPSVNYPDSLMVLLSTAGTDTSSFTTILDYIQVPKTGWTRFQYHLAGLPQNSTVNVAFRYLHFNGGSTGSNSDFIGIDAVRFTRQLATSVEEAPHLPITASLKQNYPNPFNPSTTIEFELNARSLVRMQIVDLLGRTIAVLVDGVKESGGHSVTWNAVGIASGVYFCRFENLGQAQTRKVVLIR